MYQDQSCWGWLRQLKRYLLHPVAAAVRAAWASYGIENMSRAEADSADPEHKADISEIAGHGIKAVIDSKTIYVGNEKLMDTAGVDVSAAKAKIASISSEAAGTVIFLAEDGRFMGYIIIADEIKETTAEAIAKLKKLGVKNTVMLTGDKREVAEAVAKEIGLDTFCAELLPGDKVSKVEELLEAEKAAGNDGRLAFTGDGINDAPVLMRSDIGIAMGRMGSDAAIEAADVVIMDDNIMRVSLAVRIARKTMRIVHQNIVVRHRRKACDTRPYSRWLCKYVVGRIRRRRRRCHSHTQCDARAVYKGRKIT